MLVKILLAYATRYEATAEATETIAGVLGDKLSLEIDIKDLKKEKNVDIEPYDNIILGVSIAKFNWAKEGKKFLENDFTGKKIHVFVSSGNAEGEETHHYHQ
ncbi:MAG: flavodoxin family protein [Candidatus Hodarchaeales archaeon]